MDFGQPKHKKWKVESEAERRSRLDKKNEKTRNKRKAETTEEKRERLSKRNEKDRAK